MFSALAASASTILAALLQKLKTTPKHLRIFICLVAVICVVLVILAITKEKHHEDNENTERSVTIGIINIDININYAGLQKEEIKVYANEIIRLYGITSPEVAEEIYNRIKEGLNE